MISVYMMFVALLFFIGMYSLLANRNVVKLLIGLEIMSKAVVLSFATAGYFRGETFLSQSLIITFIVVEVSLVAVALALVINAYRSTGSLDVNELSKLKG